MKNALLILLTIFAISCEEALTVEGEFIYLEDAAVLKGDSFIYGVKLDEKTKELANMIKPIQRDKFDMVPVILKATIAAKEEGKEGWDSIITIKEIIQVKAPEGESTLRLEAGDQLKTEGTAVKVENDTLSQN